jgi:hypothetical protein
MIAIEPMHQGRPIEDHRIVAFDITDGNRRVACTLKTSFGTKGEAKRYFHANRPLIEQMAREQMAAGLEDGKVRLAIEGGEGEGRLR